MKKDRVDVDVTAYSTRETSLGRSTEWAPGD